jgi:hypothetical protein
VTWSGALGVLLIVLVYGWPYITRVLSAVVPPTREPPPESSAADDFRRRLANFNVRDLEPPTDLHASEPWDEYWRRQHESGVWAFNEMFVNDRELVRMIEARGFQTVLCIGAGLAFEPHALAAAGLRVTMLDISRSVVAAMSEATIPSDAFSRILDSSQLRPGGRLECVAGDLTDPAVCPGLYDVVIERRTLQLFPPDEREAALAAVAARMNPNGVLFTHTHDGRGGPGRPRNHAVEPFLERCGFTLRDFEGAKSATGRTAITFLSTG